MASLCSIPMATVTVLMLYVIVKQNKGSLSITTDTLNKSILKVRWLLSN